ncbi:uncharacterized protein H6S33_002848 [Morchella sextelata]|uniref:uncharacterized protein n=1 Tax=Morchella sextelata TaxID=1174677 RepID=UPI001D04541C|nr:uncharacterized protein H6S33_002848 [Morchella sextelata]KAH0607814.1 hypothetical protein H6S33_002848 [Morchella sextelata]
MHDPKVQQLHSQNSNSKNVSHSRPASVTGRCVTGNASETALELVLLIPYMYVMKYLYDQVWLKKASLLRGCISYCPENRYYFTFVPLACAANHRRSLDYSIT